MMTNTMQAADKLSGIASNQRKLLVANLAFTATILGALLMGVASMF
jgi:hypothetical protein